MVLDAFLFHDELDLLEIRLNILDPYVDKFVLVESIETFSGLPKPLHFFAAKNTTERFKKWEHKIIHHVVDGYSDEEWAEAKASSNTNGLDHWCREYIQRENIKKGLIKAGATDEDIVFFGDVDEVWDPKHLFMWAFLLTQGVGSLKMKLLVYSYWLNNKSSEDFWGNVVSLYRDVKDTSLNHLRSKKGDTSEARGWHFTSMGGTDALKKKIESYGHQEFNTEEIKNGLEYRLSTGQDFIGRDFRYTIDESEWPSFLKETKSRYKHLIK